MQKLNCTFTTEHRQMPYVTTIKNSEHKHQEKLLGICNTLAPCYAFNVKK